MNNVSKTLYIPLYGKQYVSKKGIILWDPKAEEIWAAEGFPLRGKAKSKWLAYYMGMRSAVFDSWVRARMQENSRAFILHIGCGMDSRVLRVGDSRADNPWYDVDFPEVIEERKRYYQEDDGYHMLAADARETGWISQLPRGETGIVVMEGLSMYLRQEELKALLNALCRHFVRLHLLMDCYTSFGAKASRYKNPINSVGVTQTYGIDDPAQVTNDTDLRFVQEHIMTPDALMRQLQEPERFFFRKVFAGGFAARIYRMYEFDAQTEPQPEELLRRTAGELAKTGDLNSANRYFDTLTEAQGTFVKITNNTYRIGDVMINTGIRFAMEAHARGLDVAKCWGLASAPELVSYTRLKDGTSCVLITRIEGISRSMPVPCSGAAWQHITPEGSRQLIADAEKLREHGMINESILNTQEWHTVPSSGAIVISNWSRVRQLENEEEGRRMVETVRKELSDRGLI